MMMESGENLLQLTQHRRQWKLECFMNLVQLKLQKIRFTLHQKPNQLWREIQVWGYM